jgi:hypothetical protein
MCLVLFSFDLHPEYQYIVAGNRDEFYERSTQPLGFWKDEPLILAGRDLVGGGAWLGITKTLKFAAITNYRDSSAIKKMPPPAEILFGIFWPRKCLRKGILSMSGRQDTNTMALTSS